MPTIQDFKSCWEILGIDEYSDLGAIKSAYAKKIKLSKPDENPSEFSILNAAYKDALRLTKNCNFADNKKSVKILNIYLKDEDAEINGINLLEESKQNDDIIAFDNSTLFNEQDKYYDSNKLKDDKKKLYNDLAEVLDHKKRNKLKEWKKILQNELFQDLRIKLEISHFLFSKFIELNRLFPNKKRIKVLPVLNTFFNWTEKRSVFEKKFNAYEVAAILNECDKTDFYLFKDKSSYKFIKRSLAGFLDIIILLLISIIVQYIFAEVNKFGTCIILTLIIPIIEASPLQSSLGKAILGLKVVDSLSKKKISMSISFERFCYLFYALLKCYWRSAVCLLCIYLLFNPIKIEAGVLVIFMFMLFVSDIIIKNATSVIKFLLKFICLILVTLFLLVFFINMINFEFAVILLFIIYMLSIYKEAFEIIDENTSTVVVRRSNSNRLK